MMVCLHLFEWTVKISILTVNLFLFKHSSQLIVALVANGHEGVRPSIYSDLVRFRLTNLNPFVHTFADDLPYRNF